MVEETAVQQKSGANISAASDTVPAQSAVSGVYCQRHR